MSDMVPYKSNWRVIDEEVTHRRPTQEMVPYETTTQEIVRRAADRPGTSVMRRSLGQQVIERPRQITVNGNRHEVDSEQLMRMIKQVTQTIGEYKNTDSVFADFVVPAMRKARADMVSALEGQFGIHWKIDDGVSVFYK